MSSWTLLAFSEWVLRGHRSVPTPVGPSAVLEEKEGSSRVRWGMGSLVVKSPRSSWGRNYSRRRVGLGVRVDDSRQWTSSPSVPESDQVRRRGLRRESRQFPSSRTFFLSVTNSGKSTYLYVSYPHPDSCLLGRFSFSIDSNDRY